MGLAARSDKSIALGCLGILAVKVGDAEYWRLGDIFGEGALNLVKRYDHFDVECRLIQRFR